MPDMEISPEELDEWMKKPGPRPFRLIDVREEDEFAICHLDQAELIPLSGFAGQSQQRFKDHNETVVIYCHHGMRSSHAANYLRSTGCKKVYNLTGGIDVWAERIDLEMRRY